jgi:hypothetical protein
MPRKLRIEYAEAKMSCKTSVVGAGGSCDGEWHVSEDHAAAGDGALAQHRRQCGALPEGKMKAKTPLVISDPFTNWFTVPNSTETNLFTLPFDPAHGSVFFRLRSPN